VIREKEVVTPTPAPVVQPTPVVVTPVETAPVILPKTGIDDVLAIVALAAAGGTLAHMFYARRKYMNGSS
jgi:hypothetical protein